MWRLISRIEFDIEWIGVSFLMQICFWVSIESIKLAPTALRRPEFLFDKAEKLFWRIFSNYLA